MTRSLQAVYEKGVLRPLQPLPLHEHQQMTVTVSDREDGDWLDAAFLRYLDRCGDRGHHEHLAAFALGLAPGGFVGEFVRGGAVRTLGDNGHVEHSESAGGDTAGAQWYRFPAVRQQFRGAESSE